MNLAPCPCCGVAGCEGRFHELLVHDFTDPEYGVVHHLVVPSYLLQHEPYTAQARAMMLEFVSSLLHTVPTDHDRRLVREAMNASNRVVRREPRERAPPRAWTLTVADVDDSSGEAYRRTVRAWAESVVATLVQS